MKKKEKKKKPKSFTCFVLGVINKLEEEERYGTAHVYWYAYKAFLEFVGGGEIFFGAINRRTLKRFEQYEADLQNEWNTISTYVRALRSVYHRAVDAEVIPGEYRLFSGVFTGTKVERKRALQDEEMRRLLADDDLCKPLHTQAEALPQTLPQALRQSRDMLSLMFRLQGMPLVDLLHLHRGDLRTDATGCTVLTCHRHKTGTPLRVTLTAEALALIDSYRSTDPESPYLLCFFDGITGAKTIYHEYCRQLRLLNCRLTRLAALRGLHGVRVSSYTARHTWATAAKFCLVPETVISEGLGHSSLEVTRTYLKSFEHGELEQANKLVMARVLLGEASYWK